MAKSKDYSYLYKTRVDSKGKNKDKGKDKLPRRCMKCISNDNNNCLNFKRACIECVLACSLIANDITHYIDI